MIKKLFFRCLIIFTIGLIIAVRYCSTLTPSSPQLTEDNGLYYEQTEHGYIFYSVNQHPLFAHQTMDNYKKLNQGIFQISGSIGHYLYYPASDCLVGPYINIKINSEEFLIEDVNGWGVLNSHLECIIPTEHTEAEIFQLLN